MTEEIIKPFNAAIQQVTFNIIVVNWELATEDNRNEKNCLYCTYGDSPIYGTNALLYIGLTTQPFSNRDTQHQKTDFGRMLNGKHRIGKINFEKIADDKEKVKLLEITESLLITMLKPSYNSSNIKTVHPEMQNKKDYYLILNHGNRGTLPLEISNIWW